MPCRGGLFRDRQVTLFTKDTQICKKNVQKHWSDYVKLSNRVQKFYTDQDGEDYLELDAFDTLKEQIVKKSTHFELNSTLKASGQDDLDTMVDLIARAVFNARSGCPGHIKQLLGECQSDDK